MHDRVLVIACNVICWALAGGFTPAAAQESLPPSAPAPTLIQALAEGLPQGTASRGAALFASPKSACLGCHRIGQFGGTIGPELSRIGIDRTPEQLIESLLWPNQLVAPKFQVHQILTEEGELSSGYVESENEDFVQLKDPASGSISTITAADIAMRKLSPSLMPTGLVNGWERSQQLNLLAFLADLGKGRDLRPELAASILEHAQSHDPTPFPYTRQPRDPTAWPHHGAEVNRDRIYEFYRQQAVYFREQDTSASLLMEYPGLDGGTLGHWGNQTEETWASNWWNLADLGSLQSGVFHGPGGQAIARAVCLRLGEQQEMSVCFDPTSRSYPAKWREGFVKFSTVRHGFLHGLIPQGDPIQPANEPSLSPNATYRGYYRLGPRTIFAYDIDGEEYLDAPWSVDGEFQREFGPRATHSLGQAIDVPVPQWPERIETSIELGAESPYAIDTIALPHDNPWQSPVFCSGHAFLADGSVMLSTMQGDVWHVTGLNSPPQVESTATWHRFASGLHHPLGVWIDEDGIFVICRDQLTRLHDLNQDGEADFYECFCNAFETSPAGHDFICGLQRDDEGYFYTASGNQGVLRIAPDGETATVLANGFRNPDGIGLDPSGILTVPCSEGRWTPASMICAVPFKSATAEAVAPLPSSPPFYGYRGPQFVSRPIEQPELPLVYLPRGIDNSAGGQVYIDSQKWGPLTGNMIHFSFGAGTHSLLLRDEVSGQLQGAVVPLPGDFLSGVHRGRFSPLDGQLYVSGMTGWGSYTPDSGCFQRVRYTGAPVILPTGFHLHRNGVALYFPQPLEGETSQQVAQHFAQAWNYRYSAAYGSPEYSTQHYGVRGHDRVQITSAHLLDAGKTLFLEIPDLRPCNQLHLQIAVQEDLPTHFDMFLTCHALDSPRTDFPGAVKVFPEVSDHPILLDMLLATQRVENPWSQAIDGARTINIAAGTNLTFQTRTFTVQAGEPIALTFANPDAVPHNWALVERGQLQKVGEAANQLVSDPQALIQQYVPQVPEVLCYTDIVEPHLETTIYFNAPTQPGKYPYLCTFPGHWMVMNGEMIVEP
ncbi:DUF6797 domain-containing protein [Aureliella helgolandensis]|nr:DUF6797 domain-containing protein [Aureliella helgolandensis]